MTNASQHLGKRARTATAGRFDRFVSYRDRLAGEGIDPEWVDPRRRA